MQPEVACVYCIHGTLTVLSSAVLTLDSVLLLDKPKDTCSPCILHTHVASSPYPNLFYIYTCTMYMYS